ncbi:uncharacterized protein KRP23_2856 [Phytophthora ramorum]|uniref:uncharacterized protein n=1 Tax=Phytophthora ramorum TaxID=164328 RepID=UPI0030AC9603|nr:hypothetical protein KRP23_9601 [Phytophthora ramorum]KAH7488914.1 hypothetical protein KRP23_2856 [Phytophthora ramorum]
MPLAARIVGSFQGSALLVFNPDMRKEDGFNWYVYAPQKLVMVRRKRSSVRTRVMYSVTTHYADKDTSCGGTPYRINVEEIVSECSGSDCAASVNGLYDGVASSTCTRDYQNEIWTQFGSSVYILNVMYHDSECSNFAYARAYLADGECQVESTSAWYTAKLEANGSATLHHFTSDACSPDDMFMSTDRATKEDLASGACDSSLSQWFTNQGTTAAPLVSATTSGSGSASTSGTDATEATSTDTAGSTASTDTTDTHDAATSPSTPTVDASSSSGDGDSGLGAGGIAGIVCGGIIAIATVYAIVFHRDRPISITCFSASAT